MYKKVLLLIGINILLGSNLYSQEKHKKDTWYFFSHINEVNYDTTLTTIPKTAQYKYLNHFTNGIKHLIENHKWQLFLKQCDSSHFSTQNLNFLKSDPHYIKEILNLNFSNNALECNSDKTNYHCLHQIIKFEIIGIPKMELLNEERFHIFGYVHLSNGKILRTSIAIVKRAGALKIIGSVG